ncbi:MAG: right-handed parallel beta-helix repeat-containing protein [Candidatus Cloacimonetes bacterium]|nr:right-handed parallel beta-helix repeat-containing protein [Candidatus Cloacimonadota bacterium]
MKRILMTVLVASLACWLAAEITTWTTDQTFTTDYVVDSDDTLIIDTSQNSNPINIKFAAGCGLTILGSLQSLGTAADSIYFTHTDAYPYKWGGIIINNQNSTCEEGIHIRHTRISDVFYEEENVYSPPAIQSLSQSHDILIENSQISENAGMFTSGIILANTTNIQILNSKFLNNGVFTMPWGDEYYTNSVPAGGGAISLENCTNVVVQGCNIYNNDKAGHPNGESHLGAGINIHDGADITISDNEIHHNMMWSEWLRDDGTWIRDGTGGGLAIHYIDAGTNTVSGNHIHNNVAMDSGGGMYICDLTDGTNVITDNSIYSNEAERSFGGGICLTNSGGGGRQINVCDILSNNIYDNSAWDSGGVHIGGWDPDNLFTDNYIHENVASQGGGGMCFWGNGSSGGEAINIDNCSFYGNSSPTHHYLHNSGTAISFCNTGTDPDYRCTITNSTITGHEDIPIYVDEISAVDIENTILWNPPSEPGNPYELWLDAQQGDYADATILYSDVRNGENGINYTQASQYDYQDTNIESAPALYEVDYGTYIKHIPRWDATARSPCIDNGNPVIMDDDDSPSDIGAFPGLAHNYDNWELPATSTSNGWRWMCFPALDDLCQTPNYDQAEVMLASILDDEILGHIEWMPSEGNEPLTIAFLDPGWSYMNHIFTSPQGYKVKMASDDPVELPIIGFLENPGAQIDLFELAGEEQADNWVGYFLEDTKLAVDLLDGIAGSIIEVRAQHWALERVDGQWVGDTKSVLKYGEMVVIRVDEDVSFSWGGSIVPSPDGRTSSQFFAWEERAEYVPVYIEHTPENEDEEIGMLVDGVCKGAAVCGDTLTQINAYVVAEDGTIEDGTVEFVVMDGSRNYRMYDAYRLYDEKLRVRSGSQIDLDDGSRFYYISLQEEPSQQAPAFVFSLSSRPNPFNPSTTINYSLPADGHVEVSIFNVRGQKVATLVDERLQAGEHAITWEAGGFASGIYLCRMQTAGSVITHKLLLLK